MNFELLIKKCQQEGINDVEIYTLSTKTSSVETLNDKAEKNETSELNVSNVRAVYNNHIVSTYVENMTDENIPNIIKRLKEEAAFVENDDPFFMYEGEADYEKLEVKPNDLDSYSLEDMTNLVKELDKKAKESSEYVIATEGSIQTISEKKEINNTKGLHVSQEEKVGIIFFSVVVKKGEEVKTAYSFSPFLNFKDINKEKLLEESLGEGLRKLGATSYKSGQYKVLFKNSCVRSLLGAFSSQFLASSVMKKMSSLDGKIGQKIFGDNINISDDPKVNEFNLSSFDDEGVKTVAKDVVKNGKLETYLYNLQTAAFFNTKTTGNGFKSGGIKGELDVSPTNFYLQKGEYSLEELAKKVGSGIYITELQGLHAGLNPISGAFNLQSQGYLIEDGKITKPLTLIIVSGNFFEMMNNVEYIGNDLEFMGKFGAPSIVIKNLAVSGK